MLRSFRRRSVIVLLLGVVACSSDEDGANPTGTPEEEAAARVMNATATLAVQGYLGSYFQLIGSGAPAGEDCMFLSSVCSSGSAEFCRTSEGGYVNFLGCNAGSSTTNGMITITGNALTGTAVLGLTVNDAQVDATVGYTIGVEPPCLYETIQSAVVVLPSYSISGVGSLNFCGSSSVPVGGGLYGTVTTTGGPSFGFNLWFPEEGDVDPGDVSILIANVAHTEYYLICYGNVLTRTIDECEAPPDVEASGVRDLH